MSYLFRVTENPYLCRGTEHEGGDGVGGEWRSVGRVGVLLAVTAGIDGCSVLFLLRSWDSSEGLASISCSSLGGAGQGGGSAPSDSLAIVAEGGTGRHSRGI